jgi:hypothetical protein
LSLPEPDPAILISPLVSCSVSPYPVFDPDAFVASLGEQDSVVSESEFCLTDTAISALFNTDDIGNITPVLKTKYAQMLPTPAYMKDPRMLVEGEDMYGKILFEGFKTRITLPKLLVLHPEKVNPTMVNRQKGYTSIGKVLIPFQFLRMPEVWVNLERSYITISGI